MSDIFTTRIFIELCFWINAVSIAHANSSRAKQRSPVSRSFFTAYRSQFRTEHLKTRSRLGMEKVEKLKYTKLPERVENTQILLDMYIII